MIDPSSNDLLYAALAGAASLVWLVALTMALLRWRAFGQRVDLWWVLDFACLATLGMGWAWEAWSARSELSVGSSGSGSGALSAAGDAMSLLFHGAFFTAAVLAIVAYRGRSRPLD